MRFTIIIFFLIGFQLFAAHPFFVSICELDYKSESKSLEISLRIFTGDLEKTMEDWGAGRLYLGEKNESSKADSLLKAYVFQVFSFKINDQKTTYKYIGKEVEQELTWIYLESDNIPDFNTISISNRLLFQSFPNQTNLIHVNHRQEIKSLLLTKNNTSGELKW